MKNHIEPPELCKSPLRAICRPLADLRQRIQISTMSFWTNVQCFSKLVIFFIRQCFCTFSCCPASSMKHCWTIFHSLGNRNRTQAWINYPKFCIGLKIRKSRCRKTLRLQFGNSKWFSSAALHFVILDWVEQQSIVKEITPGNQNFQATGHFCQTIF